MTPRRAGGLVLLASVFAASAASAGQRLFIHGARLDIERNAVRVAGLPVLARANVVVTRGTELVASSNAALAPAPSLPPRVPAESALDSARRAIQASGIAFQGVARAPELALLPLPNGLEPVWAIDARAPWPGADRVPGVLVDATTGRVLALWNEVEHFDRARVYEHNPVVTPALSSVTLHTDPAAAHVDSAELETLNCVDEHDTRSTPLGTLHLCHLLPVAERDSNGDFLLQPAADTAPEDPFAEVNAFYAARRAYELFAGFGLSGLSSEPLPLVVNLMVPAGLDSGNLAQAGDPDLPLLPYPGAAYRTSSPVLGAHAGVDGPAIWLGQGPAADMAYDGDVVSHELVHAVVDSTVRLVPWMHADDQGLLGSPAALNEGLADYFAGVLGGDPDIGEYGAKNLGLPVMRVIDGPARCPDQLVGEPHADSLIVSRALWAVRSGLVADQRRAFDEAVFDAVVSLPGSDPGFDDFARQLFKIVAASSLAPLPALGKELAARGLYPACRRVLDWHGKPLDAPVVGGRYFAPGLYDSPWANNGRPAPLGYAPGIVQFAADVPPGSTTVTLRLSAWGATEAPRVLLSFGGSIDFDWSASRSTADRDRAALSEDGQHFEARFELPPGTERVGAMIVDPATTGFAYSEVDFAFEARSPAGAQPPTRPELVPAGGCSCRGAPPLEPGGSVLLLIGALGWAARWRRSGSRRA